MTDYRKILRRAFFITLALIAVVGVFLLLFSPLGALLLPITGDAMDWKGHYLAGIWSKDCGRVKVGADPKNETSCALSYNASGKAFRVVYNIQGIDAWVAGGIVRTPAGKLLALTYDSCPMGCGFSLLQQRAEVTPCPEPFQLHVNSKGRLNCFQQQLSPPKNIMSPNLEPY